MAGIRTWRCRATGGESPGSRRWDAPPRRSPGWLDRGAPEGEPALELGLHRELVADLRLQAKLALVVALLAASCGHEGVERAALVVVDPVDRLAALVSERDHAAQ